MDTTRTQPAWRMPIRSGVAVAALIATGAALTLTGVAHAAAGDAGSPDTAFNTNVGTSLGSSRQVFAVAEQSDGKVVVGGDFQTSLGAVSGRIARFNSDGTPDTAFNTNTSALLDNSVEDIAIQSDGKIVIVGAFNSVAGTGGGCRYVARLNSTGTVDSSFCTSFANATGARGNSVAIRSTDGAIVIGGNFTTPSSYLAVLNADGSPATTFNTTVGVSLKQPVLAVGLTSAGLIFAGGGTEMLGVGTGAVAAINADGTLTGDAGTFNTAFAASVTGTVRALAVQSDSKVVIGGDFSSPGRNIARFSANGSADSSFNTNANTVNLGGPVQDLAIDSSGRIPVAGSFSGYFKRLLGTGAIDSSFANPGVGFTAYAVGVTTDSKILLGGAFTTPGRYLARFLGEAAAGPLTYSSGAFPAATVGSPATLTVTVTNTGPGVATPSAITSAGTGVSVTGGTCAVGTGIAASGTCTVTLSWTPVAAGTLSDGLLTISYPGGAAAANEVALTGTATASGGSGGGSSSGGSTPDPSPTPTPTASLPSLGAEAAPGGLAPGADRVTVGGAPVPVVVAPNAPNTGLDVTGPGWRLSLAARTATGQPAPLGPNGVLRFVRGQGLAAEGVGFKPNSPVQLFLFSDATLLGELTTDTAGSFSGSVALPSDVAIGAHVAQVNGYTTGDEVRSVSLGVEVVESATEASSVGSRIYFPYRSARLTSKAKRTLTSLAAQVPAQSRASSVVLGIVQAQSPKPGDRALARARAMNVARYLTAAGLPGTVSIRTQPVKVKNVAEARRVVVTVRYTR